MNVPEYLNEARTVLEEMFLAAGSFKEDAAKEGLLKLIMAKHHARREGGMSFEEVLLDCIRKFDEKARDEESRRASEKLNVLAFYLERYDHVQSSFARLALADMAYSEDWINRFIESKKEFDGLRAGLFAELFIAEWLDGKLITDYGRKKIKAVASGMEDILSGKTSASALAKRMKKMAEMERHPFRSSYL